MTEIINTIKQDEQILIAELGNYGSYVNPKHKNSRDKKYNCCNCTSSDALGIKKTDKGYIYHCFSCGTTGDVISLVQEKEGITFTEALKVICDRHGISNDISIKRSVKKTSKQTLIEKYEKLEKEALTNKDLDKAFEYHMKISNIKNNNYKKITDRDNYANYKAKQIEIKKYIGEDKDRNIWYYWGIWCNK